MNEREMEILERYPFRTERISRVRGAFLCETEDGLRLLKETDSTEKRLRWENSVLLQFPEDSHLWVEAYVENRDGELVTQGSDHRRYSVKRWIEGRECNMGDVGEILRTVEYLAELHVMFREILEKSGESFLHGRDEMPEKHDECTWVSDMERHNRELIRVRNYIRKKRRKTELELKIIGDFPEYYNLAMEACQLAKETSHIMPGLYHGDFTHHHVLYHGRRAAVIEFAHMGIGVQQEDLYLFLRKAMEKHGWDIKLGMAMLERYETIRPLSGAERRFLYVRLLYPEKFWKQVNYYCNSRKSWMPLRNLEKLKTLERQKEQKEVFLSALRGRMM